MDELKKMPPEIISNTVPPKVDFELYHSFEYELMVLEGEAYNIINLSAVVHYCLAPHTPELYSFQTLSTYEIVHVNNEDMATALTLSIYFGIMNFNNLFQAADIPEHLRHRTFFHYPPKSEIDDLIKQVLN